MNRLGLCLALALGAAAHAQTEFIHPGLLQSQADLDRIRTAVAAKAEPIWSGFQKFARDPGSNPHYVLRGPFPEIGRPSVHTTEFDRDANASYQCALRWAITRDHAAAAKSEQILDAWAGTLRRVSGADAVLMAGLGPFKMVNAAEILRSTAAGWPEDHVRQFQKMSREVIYPVLRDFAPFANGNWDTAALKTVMAIAVFCDDRPMFERALKYYEAGWGDGCLEHYIAPDGQCEESGRDQAHTQLGLAHLGDCCEIAWHQGLDLYGLLDNRLLRGFEYTAKYNLGFSVPFTPDLDRTGKYRHGKIATEQRGVFRPVFEQIYNHYVNRRGLAAPFTAQAAERIRPEGAHPPGADHPGFGTLLYSRPRASEPPPKQLAAPAGVIAHGRDHGIALSWVAPIGAQSYAVERRRGDGGAFEEIARGIRTAHYADARVEAGQTYEYVVAAADGAGSSGSSAPAEACAGLPAPWTQCDLGSGLPGQARIEDGILRIEAGGFGHFVNRTLEGDGTLTVRFLPQPSCQFSSFGLSLRESAAPNAAAVSLLIASHPASQLELPDWTIDFASARGLPVPGVAYSRLMVPIWLRLSRSAGAVTGEISSDGVTWTRRQVAPSALPGRVLIGIVAASGLPAITTTVRIDRFEFTPAKP